MPYDNHHGHMLIHARKTHQNLTAPATRALYSGLPSATRSRDTPLASAHRTKHFSKKPHRKTKSHKMTKNDTEPTLQIENPVPIILSSPADGEQFPLGDDFPNFGPAGHDNINDSGIVSEAADASSTHDIGLAADDIMDKPISINAPPAMFERKGDHPVDRLGVINMDGVPVGTNKFWANLILGNGNLGVFTQPYV